MMEAIAAKAALVGRYTVPFWRARTAPVRLYLSRRPAITLRLGWARMTRREQYELQQFV